MELMVDEQLGDLIEYASMLTSPDSHAYNQQGKYFFGLTGSLEVLKQIKDSQERNIAQTIVTARFIANRAPQLYNMMQADISKKLVEAIKGTDQENLVQFARRVESASRHKILSEIIHNMQLKPTLVAPGVELYLPVLESSTTDEIPHSVHNYLQENPHAGLESFLDSAKDYYELSLIELKKDNNYVPEFTERFLGSLTHYSIIEFLRQTTKQEFPEFSEITHFNEVRAAMPQAPGIEYAIRLQLKENPHYGEELDKEYNRLILTSAEQTNALGENTINNPILLYNNKSIKCHRPGNA